MPTSRSDDPIVIASIFAPTYPGGLAAYQRKLAAILSARTSFPGVFLYCNLAHPELPATAEAELAFPMFPLEPTRLGRATRRLWPKLASRPWTFGLLRWLLVHSWKMPKNLRPRAIHFVGTGWDLVGFFLQSIAAKHGIPFTVFPAVHPGEWGDDEIDIKLYQKADTVFCQSEHECHHLGGCGVLLARLERSRLFPMCRPDGDGTAFRLAHKLGTRPCVLFIGRRDEGKGYPALLDAWKLVSAKLPDAMLLLAGPYWRADETERLAALPTESFLNLGVPDPKALSDALAACDIFCLPSAAESFGIVFLEAWSFGKPVICGTAPATRELISDNVTGLWADQNPPNLANKLLRLLQNPEERTRMGEAGRHFQQENYSEERFLDAFRTAFNLPAA